MTPLIKLEDVTYNDKQKAIVQDVSFELNSSEILTIIGPNGAGKTTLLKLILGLLKPLKGKIWRAEHLKIGYMPQKIEINPLLPLTVKGFLALSQSTAITRNQLEETLRRLGGTHLKNEFLTTLSGGEWQRILLAHALLRQPNLLILDEPAQGVDVVGQIEFYQLLATLRKELECSIILVSHDLHLVMAATDKVICLNGHICCSGHPQVVMNDPRYQQLFGVQVYKDSLNGVVPYVHHHDHRHDEECI
jgi:zinc transport system ATP-binding protein